MFAGLLRFDNTRSMLRVNNEKSAKVGARHGTFLRSDLKTGAGRNSGDGATPEFAVKFSVL